MESGGFVAAMAMAGFGLCLSAQALAGTSSTDGRGASGMQPFTVGDLVRLERISELAVAPDGKRIAYTLRTTDLDANKGRTGIWLLDPRRHAAGPVRLTDLGANARAAAWSADGQYLYYLSNRTGSNQVWRIDARRIDARRIEALRTAPVEDARQITNLPLDVGSFRVSPQDDRLVVSLDVFTDCPDLACTQQRLDAATRSAGHGLLFDSVFVRHWDTWSDGRRSQLYMQSLDVEGQAMGEPQRLTTGIDGDVPGKPFGGREAYAFSPDGRHVAFTVRSGRPGEPWSTNFDIFEVDTQGGTPRNLTAGNPAADTQPTYSPDGRTLAYLAQERPGAESDRCHLVLLDLKSGAVRPLTRGWDRSIANFAWAPDGRSLYATADHLGQHPLWAIDAATGRAAAITGEGHVEDFAVGPHQVLYTESSLAGPADLFSVGFSGGTPRQLTTLNQEILAHRHLGAFHQFDFAGWHDEHVYGYVVEPADFEPGRRYPVALVVHGGPEGSMANEWHWRWNAQVLAGAGYAVLMIDFHGSTGYGQAFTDSIREDWGGKPFEDLKRGLAAALGRYPWMDGERACALGGSYGGYMMNWIAGQWPDRFRCLVTHDGIFDNRTMYYATEELWFPEWENGGPEFARPEAYAKHNPVDYVARWQTPTLVIHGQLDYRVPYSQGLAVFTALQRRGIPSELLFFPDENHWVLKPRNSMQWYDTVIAWLDRWTAPGPSR